MFMKLGWTPPADDNDDGDLIQDLSIDDPMFDLDLLWPTDDVDDDEEYSSDSDVSISAPPYSPLQQDTEILPNLDQGDVSVAPDYLGTSSNIDTSDSLASTDQILPLTPIVESAVITSTENVNLSGQLIWYIHYTVIKFDLR